MAIQTAPGPGRRRHGRAAAAQVRRRHLIFLLVLLAGIGGLGYGVKSFARYLAPWGNFVWILGEPGFLDRPRNVLVVGLDRESRGARGDLYMLVRMDPRFPSVTVVSVPVETQTTIPGYGVGKLEDVPAVGGGPLARQTIEALLGISVDRLLVFDPGGARAVVDKLGGVDLLVPKAFSFSPPGGPAVSLPAGKRRLDGRQAIAFATYRSKDAGDLKRVARQQFVASALLRQANGNPWKLPDTSKTIALVARGDFKPLEVEEAIRFLQSRPVTRFTLIPGNPGYADAWIPHPGRIADLLGRIEKARERTGARPPVAEIRFSADREKAASGLANSLVDRGVTVVRTAPLEEEDATHVVAREPSGRVDNVVRTLLPAAPWVLSDDPSPYSADYTIVVGRDAPDVR